MAVPWILLASSSWHEPVEELTGAPVTRSPKSCPRSEASSPLQPGWCTSAPFPCQIPSFPLFLALLYSALGFPLLLTPSPLSPSGSSTPRAVPAFPPPSPPPPAGSPRWGEEIKKQKKEKKIKWGAGEGKRPRCPPRRGSRGGHGAAVLRSAPAGFSGTGRGPGSLPGSVSVLSGAGTGPEGLSWPWGSVLGPEGRSSARPPRWRAARRGRRLEGPHGAEAPFRGGGGWRVASPEVAPASRRGPSWGSHEEPAGSLLAPALHGRGSSSPCRQPRGVRRCLSAC